MSPQDFYDTIALEDLVLSANVQVSTSTAGVSLRFRVGSPVFVEDFELASPNWGTTTIGAGAVSQRQAVYWYSAGAAWELTVADPGPQYADFYIHLGRLPAGNIGLSWCWSLSAAAQALAGLLYFPLAGALYTMGVRYDGASGDIQILDDTVSWVSVITAPAVELDEKTYHFVKITGAMVDGAVVYKSLQFNEHDVDISAYAPDSGTLAAGFPLVIAFTHLNTSGYPASVFVDNVALTVGES